VGEAHAGVHEPLVILGLDAVQVGQFIDPLLVAFCVGGFGEFRPDVALGAACLFDVEEELEA
jgi:hypothetical protein